MSLKLYELTESYNNIQALLDDDSDEALIMALDSIEGAIQEKAGNIAKLIKSLEYNVDVIKAEETRLSNLRKARENKVKSLKSYIQAQMEKVGIEEVKSPTMTVSLQKNGNPSLIIVDEKKVPAKYITIIPEQKQIDKKAIVKDIKDKPVKWAQLEYGNHIRIR